MKSFGNYLIFLIFLIFIVGGFSCRENSKLNQDDFTKTNVLVDEVLPESDVKKKLIVTTTTMVTDLVENIVGDNFVVKGLMGPTIDPHLYNIKVNDNILLTKADVIFYSGLHLEGKMAVDLEFREKKGQKVYGIGDNLDKNNLLYIGETGDVKKIPDPHIWGDVLIWIQATDYVYSKLSEIFPEYKNKFKKNYIDFRGELEALHEWVKMRTQSLDKDKRVLISSHDAFEYFGRAYDFKVIGLQGISTVTEASLKDITITIDYVKKNNIKAIFIESTTSPKAIKKIVESTGVKIGGTLFSDAMGERGRIEKFNGDSYDVGTYIGMIKHNINTIISSLE